MFADPPSKDWRVIPDNQESLTTKFYERLKVKGKVSHSVVSDSFVTPWTVTHQAHLFMGFSRQVYWSRWPFPSPGDLPDPGIELRSPTVQAESSPTEPPVQRNVTGLCSIMTQSVLRLCPWEIFTQWKRKIKEEDKTRLELEGMGPGLHHWPGAPVGLGFTPPSLGFLTWKCGCWTARWFYSKKSAIPRTVNQNCLDEMIYHIIQQAYFLAFKNFFLGI